MKKIQIIMSVSLIILSIGLGIPGQSGGSFVIEKSVISGSGGRSGGGAFVLDATAGQPLAGRTSTGGTFELASGFWGGGAPASFVSISGRVSTPDGLGLRNATVKLVDQSGSIRAVITSQFGFYSFDNVRTAQSYTVLVLSKRFRFTSRTASLDGTLTNFDFVGIE